MAERQRAPEHEISVDKDGRLHFDGSTEELHTYIDRLNETVARMNREWEKHLDPRELRRVAEIRDWWKEDSGGVAELTLEGWPRSGFPEAGTQAFEYMREISRFHQIAEGRMIEEEEARDRQSQTANPAIPAQ
jgi:hypothetical protein